MPNTTYVNLEPQTYAERAAVAAQSLGAILALNTDQLTLCRSTLARYVPEVATWSDAEVTAAMNELVLAVAVVTSALLSDDASSE